MGHRSFFAVVFVRPGRRSCRVVTAAPVLAGALVAWFYGDPSLASTVLPRSRDRRSLPVAFVGSLFPFLVSLFVPIIFPGYGDLWGSYGWGLPTLSNVTFQVRKKQQLFNAKRQSSESFNRVNYV